MADLPCAGRRVILALTVRKFVCGTPTCPRQIFTERLADLVQSYARMTNRLREALVALGLATSAQVSERLAPSLGMKVSAPTLLRRLRAVACPPPTSVRILGVDDWACGKCATKWAGFALSHEHLPSMLSTDVQSPKISAPQAACCAQSL